MQRILVIGSNGAGKTTFSYALAKKTELPLTHIDRLYWHGRWEVTARKEFEHAARERTCEEPGSSKATISAHSPTALFAPTPSFGLNFHRSSAPATYCGASTDGTEKSASTCPTKMLATAPHARVMKFKSRKQVKAFLNTL